MFRIWLSYSRKNVQVHFMKMNTTYSKWFANFSNEVKLEFGIYCRIGLLVRSETLFKQSQLFENSIDLFILVSVKSI